MRQNLLLNSYAMQCNATQRCYQVHLMAVELWQFPKIIRFLKTIFFSFLFWCLSTYIIYFWKCVSVLFRFFRLLLQIKSNFSCFSKWKLLSFSFSRNIYCLLHFMILLCALRFKSEFQLKHYIDCKCYLNCFSKYFKTKLEKKKTNRNTIASTDCDLLISFYKIQEILYIFIGNY